MPRSSYQGPLTRLERSVVLLQRLNFVRARRARKVATDEAVYMAEAALDKHDFECEPPKQPGQREDRIGENWRKR